MASTKLMDLYGFEIQPTVQQQAERLECDATCEVRPPPAPGCLCAPGRNAAPARRPPPLSPAAQRETYTWKPYIERTKLPSESKAKDLVRKGVPPTLRTWVRAAASARCAPELLLLLLLLRTGRCSGSSSAQLSSCPAAESPA
jgi:hypothetical protein